MVLCFYDFPCSPHQELLWGGMMPLALLAALPPYPCVEQDTKNHEHHSNYRTKAMSARRCFYLHGRGDVWVQLPPCFQGHCHHGGSWPNMELLRSLLQPIGKMTARNICRSLHLPCSHCWTAISIEKQIRVRTLPGMLPITGVSSGEGCFLFGLFQIGKLYEVQLRQTDQDCRDCLFPVLAGSWMMHE